MKRLITCLLFSTACGDNYTLAPDGGPRSDGGPRTDGGPLSGKIAAVAGDYASTGVLTVLDLATLTVSTPRPNIAEGDPLLRREGDTLYVINRFGSNNITEVNANTLAVSDQWSTGAGSNPQDVAVATTNRFVPTLDAPGIFAKTGPGYPLASLDVDGNPNCVAAHVIGSKLYVACGVLDMDFQPRATGQLAVIDLNTDQVESFDLPDRNPIGRFYPTPDGDALLLSLVPAFNDNSLGCLARIPLDNPGQAECLHTNASLGGFISRAEYDARGILWVLRASFSSDFSVETGSLHQVGQTIEPALTPATMLVRDFVACGDALVIADDTANASGLRVFESTGERTSAALPIGLPPANTGSLACLP